MLPACAAAFAVASDSVFSEGGTVPLHSSPPGLHEIPADVLVRVLAEARDGELTLAIRVPLASMRDVVFPTRGPGYVVIPEATPMLAEQADLWVADYATLYEGSRELPALEVRGTRISIPSDPSFSDLDRAVANIMGPPLASETDLILEQAMLDIVLVVPISSEESRFSIDPRWAHLGLRTRVAARFFADDGDRIFQFEGNPGRIPLDPTWLQASARFVRLGFAHILDGLDHLLFLLCLILPVRGIRPLLPVVTAFTVAHSITLVSSALGVAPRGLWFPPFIETLIAASIVFMAIENIFGARGSNRIYWAYGFGLVHGFGFSFALSESLQFAGSHHLSALLAFNVGVELGQLAVLAVIVPILAFVLRSKAARKTAVIAGSALIAHEAWHWMADRWTALREYRLGASGALPGSPGPLEWVLLLAIASAGFLLLLFARRKLAAPWRIPEVEAGPSV